MQSKAWWWLGDEVVRSSFSGHGHIRRRPRLPELIQPFNGGALFVRVPKIRAISVRNAAVLGKSVALTKGSIVSCLVLITTGAGVVVAPSAAGPKILPRAIAVHMR